MPYSAYIAWVQGCAPRPIYYTIAMRKKPEYCVWERGFEHGLGRGGRISSRLRFQARERNHPVGLPWAQEEWFQPSLEVPFWRPSYLPFPGLSVLGFGLCFEKDIWAFYNVGLGTPVYGTRHYSNLDSTHFRHGKVASTHACV